MRRNCLYTSLMRIPREAALRGRSPHPLEQHHKFEKIRKAKGRPLRTKRHHRIDGIQARARRWHGAQLAVIIVEVDAILPPVVPVRDQLQLAAMQRVERMRYSETLWRFTSIGCSRQLVPTPSRGSLRGTLRFVGTIQVSRPDSPARRSAPAYRRSGVRRALPPREEPPGPRKRADRPGGHFGIARRATGQ